MELLILVLCCVVAVLASLVRLPGTWFIVVTAVAYGWWTDWHPIGLGTLLLLAGLAVVGELIELLFSVITAKRAGASRQAAWGGLIGGIIGMFALSFLVPIPVIGTVVGALVGCFLGALVGAWLLLHLPEATFKKVVPVWPPRFEIVNYIQGYSSPGKLVEIEVTAERKA